MKLLKRLRSYVSIGVAAAVILAGPAAGLAQSSYYFWWQVVDEYNRPYTGQNVSCGVWRPNQHAAAVLHATSNLANNTAANDPLTSNSQGKLHFYSSSNAPVDVVCTYAGGGMAQVNKLDVNTHKIIIPRSEGRKVARFSVNAATANYQQDSGIVVPQGAVIRDVIVQNLNPLSLGTYHLSVGFLGNHAVGVSNALVSAIDLTPSGVEWLRPGLVPAAGGAVTATYLGNHRGTALSSFHASTCNGGVCGGPGLYIEKPYVVHLASGLGVSYSAQPGTGGALRAHVFVLYEMFHTGANRFGLTN
jgi:hypothetical protein